METVQRAGKGKWGGDLRSELEMRSYARRRSALVIWTDCCMFTFARLLSNMTTRGDWRSGGPMVAQPGWITVCWGGRQALCAE